MSDQQKKSPVYALTKQDWETINSRITTEIEKRFSEQPWYVREQTRVIPPYVVTGDDENLNLVQKTITTFAAFEYGLREREDRLEAFMRLFLQRPWKWIGAIRKFLDEDHV